jgi:hypothetical protein
MGDAAERSGLLRRKPEPTVMTAGQLAGRGFIEVLQESSEHGRKTLKSSQERFKKLSQIWNS